MKELSIEEKIKAYDKIMDRAKKELDACGSQDCDAARQIFRLFPELMESEDERIRKSLCKAIWTYIPTEEGQKYIAWLEKQGEQKLYVNDNAKEMFIKALERVEEQNNKGYKLTDCDKNSWWEDFKAYTSCTTEHKPAETEKGAKGNDREIPNSAWSEEDEMFVHGLIRGLAAMKNIHGHTTFSSDNIDITKTIDRLKSLRPQSQWKPSGFHLECISDAIVMYETRGINAIGLKEILEELKKLREE